MAKLGERSCRSLVKVGDGTYIDPSVVIAVLPAHNMARGSYAFVGPAEDDHFYFAEVEPDELVALLSEANRYAST